MFPLTDDKPILNCPNWSHPAHLTMHRWIPVIAADTRNRRIFLRQFLCFHVRVRLLWPINRHCCGIFDRFWHSPPDRTMSILNNRITAKKKKTENENRLNSIQLC